MNILIFILLFFIFACSYPDIDTVPEFNLKKTLYEKCINIDLININTDNNCEIIKIINRL